jgi:rhodanese-related sulfurtransferase
MSADPMRGLLEISVDELDGLLGGAGVAVLDVREDWEWRRGHVPGAIHVPLAQLPNRLDELPGDKDLAVICEHGERSLVGAHFLRARGLKGAMSVSGGTAAWIRAGRPIERG